MSDDLIEVKFRNHEERIGKLEKIYIIMAKMETTLNNVEAEVTGIKEKISTETDKKGMKWDKLIDYIFYAVLAYCLYKLGVKK